MGKGLNTVNLIAGFLKANRTGLPVIQDDVRSDWNKSEVTPGGAIRYNFGVAFSLTGRASSTKFIIALEPDDTYTVYVWRLRKRGDTRPIIGEVLERHDGIYWDMMLELLEALYNEYVYGEKRSSRWVPEYAVAA